MKRIINWFIIDVFFMFTAVIGAIVSAATSGRSHGGGGGGGGSYGGGHGHASYATPTRTKTIILKKGKRAHSLSLSIYIYLFQRNSCWPVESRKYTRTNWIFGCYAFYLVRRFHCTLHCNSIITLSHWFWFHFVLLFFFSLINICVERFIIVIIYLTKKKFKWNLTYILFVVWIKWKRKLTYFTYHTNRYVILISIYIGILNWKKKIKRKFRFFVD